uniref:Uncharacterized protein n=1 Tax=Lynx canadensis TaxID=61383 RepID=A0A667H5D6_LYNCA
MTVLAPLRLKESRTTDKKGHACLSLLPVWLAGKEKNFHVVKEEAGREDSEIKSKNQAGPRCPAGCKMQFN